MRKANAERETQSDKLNDPVVWYVYIMEKADGSLYIGQSNDLPTRVAEHAMGTGSEVTSGQSPRLVWFTHTHSRDNARAVEARLKRALAKTPQKIHKTIADFAQLVKMVRPEKTPQERMDEDKRYVRDMLKLFHYAPTNVFTGAPDRAACGWDGGPDGILVRVESHYLLSQLDSIYDRVLPIAGPAAAHSAMVTAGGGLPKEIVEYQLLPCKQCCGEGGPA